MNKLIKFLVIAGAGIGIGGNALAQTQGVTDTEIRVGSSTDLSGIFAAFGAPAVKAAQLYFDDINESGGVYGRKIKFIVEDHNYQLPKAAQAINKLVNRDKIFVMLMQLGTPMNLASFKLLDARKIPNVSPLSAARQMLQEPSDYRFVGGPSFYDQMKAGVSYFVDTKGITKVCTMYIPSDFGKEVQAGAKDQAKALGLTYAAETTHKPDDADFVGSLTKLKEAGCELVTMALGVRQAITAYATARKIGWTNVDFIGSAAGFHTVMAKVPGGVTEGLYAAASTSDILPRIGNPVAGAWFKKYTEATGEKIPSTGAVLGRSAAETFIRALKAAGKDLTPESFRAGMEGLNYYDPISDNQVDYSREDHQGADEIIISVVENGNWKELARK